MKTLFLALCGALFVSQTAWAQYGGGAITDLENLRTPAQIEAQKRQEARLPADATREERAATYLEAGVLINARADEYVAVFAVAQREKTAVEADTKIKATINSFVAALQKTGVKSADIFVDSVLQNRVYTFVLQGDSGRAREEFVGFEIKKNVSVRFRNKSLLDGVISTATKLGIYDLVKVDYIVKDVASIQAQLEKETARIIQSKLERYQKLGAKTLQITQIIADSPGIYQPIGNYSSYQAATTNTIEVNRLNYTVEKALVPSTAYFNPLDGNGFDLVINPVIVEPVVQFTSYVKVKCETEAMIAASRNGVVTGTK